MQRITITDSSKIEPREYVQKKHNLKPDGFWYSLGTEWMEWVGDNMPEWICDNVIEIDIDLSKVLVLETVEQCEDFFKKYGFEVCSGIHYIDWEQVCKNHTGVEIRNYYDLKWSKSILDKSHYWLYPWDVSSGCIWDLSIIKNYEVKPYNHEIKQ